MEEGISRHCLVDRRTEVQLTSHPETQGTGLVGGTSALPGLPLLSYLLFNSPWAHGACFLRSSRICPSEPGQCLLLEVGLEKVGEGLWKRQPGQVSTLSLPLAPACGQPGLKGTPHT